MNTFGKTDPSETKTQKTSFKIIQKNGSLKKVDAKIVKTISGPMSKRKLNLDKYKAMCRGRDMVAEPTGKEIQIYILNGCSTQN